MKKLLITIAHKIKNAEGNFWREAYMFVEVTIKYGIIYLPEGLTIDEEEARAYAAKAKIPLATYLERFIMNTPEVLDVCKKHRVGYTRPVEPKSPDIPTSAEIEAHRWTKFIISTLHKKKDFENAKRIARYGTFQFPKPKSVK